MPIPPLPWPRMGLREGAPSPRGPPGPHHLDDLDDAWPPPPDDPEQEDLGPLGLGASPHGG
eukprot:672114-Pyramimonas_sp.AAC.1